jgi:hypothetical protein
MIPQASRPPAHLAGVTVLLVAALAADSATAQTTYRLYFLGGQSNMDGYGDVSDVPETLRAPMPGVMIFHGNTVPDDSAGGGQGVWRPLQPGHGVGFSSDGRENTYSDRFGVELTFAQRLRELDPGSQIAIVKYSRGGTSIAVEAAGHFGSWDPDYGDRHGVNQWDHFLAALRNAMAAGDIDGDGVADVLVPAGIVWMQGESDGAHTAEIAYAYLANLTRLMALVRAALRVDDLPVVIGRISDSGQDADGLVWDYGDVIRAAQAAFVERDPVAALVTTTDEYAYSDPWHYDSRGYLDLGRRFAEAVFGLRRR